MPRLENWSVRLLGPADPFIAPERGARRLAGNVYGHPRHQDGAAIVSSPIVDAYGREVVTDSGTIYELGEPDQDWLRFLLDNDICLDPEQPVKLWRPEG